MSILEIERIGGLANFGGARSHIRSHGQLDTSTLSAREKEIVDSLFEKEEPSAQQVADGFQYRITRKTSKGSETVVVGESAVPMFLSSRVKDDFV